MCNIVLCLSRTFAFIIIIIAFIIIIVFIIMSKEDLHYMMFSILAKLYVHYV